MVFMVSNRSNNVKHVRTDKSLNIYIALYRIYIHPEDVKRATFSQTNPMTISLSNLLSNGDSHLRGWPHGPAKNTTVPVSVINETLSC